jgi:hypothetical protein
MVDRVREDHAQAVRDGPPTFEFSDVDGTRQIVATDEFVRAYDRR